MSGIMRARSRGFLGSEFNNFLYAPIGVDQHGENLSVVSALARLDLDPWKEAAKLAKLPGNLATQNLSALIVALQEIPSARQDPGKIAARLVALLPGTRNMEVTRTLAVGVPKTMVVSPPTFYVFLCAFAIMIAIQLMMHSVQPPASPPIPHVTSSILHSNSSLRTQVPPD